MNIKLKKIKFFTGHEGMTGLNADIWIKGVKCMHVYDSANGGCFEYTNFARENKNPERVKSLIKDFEDYLLTLPKREMIVGGVKKEYSVDMDMFINELVDKYVDEKNAKKMNKYMAQHILFGVPKGGSYKLIKATIPLKDIPKANLQIFVNTIKTKYCKNGVQILNTNLTELGVNL